jgi:hypothetical protein
LPRAQPAQSARRPPTAAASPRRSQTRAPRPRAGLLAYFRPAPTVVDGWAIGQAIKAALSPRHVPNDIFQVSAIPRTLSGKKMELPVKKLLLGADAAQVMNRDAMANADCVGWFVDYAERLTSKLAAKRSG